MCAAAAASFGRGEPARCAAACNNAPACQTPEEAAQRGRPAAPLSGPAIAWTAYTAAQHPASTKQPGGRPRLAASSVAWLGQILAVSTHKRIKPRILYARDHTVSTSVLRPIRHGLSRQPRRAQRAPRIAPPRTSLSRSQASASVARSRTVPPAIASKRPPRSASLRCAGCVGFPGATASPAVSTFAPRAVSPFRCAPASSPGSLPSGRTRACPARCPTNRDSLVDKGRIDLSIPPPPP